MLLLVTTNPTSRKIASVILLAATVVSGIYYFADASEHKAFKEDAVLKLMFGRGGTEAHWQVQASSLDYAMASAQLDSVVDHKLLMLIEEISSITGVGFKELSAEDMTRADVALFAGHYQDTHEFERWQASVYGLHELISSHRDTHQISRHTSDFVASMIQRSASASLDDPKPVEQHLRDGQPNCQSLSRFTASANNWALSAFGQVGAQLDPDPMRLCFLRAFLSVVGLRGVQAFANEDLIQEDQEGSVFLSPLVRCALEVFYHPTLATRVTLEDRSLDKANRVLARRGTCK